MGKITIWRRKWSVNVQSVSRCLEELDLTYCWIDDGFKHWVVTVSTFLEMNPNGKVPALIDADALATFEAGAILRQQATQPAVGTCWPKTPAATANVGKWAKQAKIDFASHFIFDVFWPLARVLSSLRDYATITEALAQIEKELAIADKVLATQAYLVGDDFSLADIQLGDRWYGYSDIDVVSRFVAFASLSQQVANKIGLFALCVGGVSRVAGCDRLAAVWQIGNRFIG